jgi:hypothetical protein
MSGRSSDFSFKLSRLVNFLLTGPGGKGRGGSTAPPREGPPAVASGEKINTMGENPERGEGGVEKNMTDSQDIRSFLVATQMSTPKRQRDQWADSPGSEDQTDRQEGA